MNRILFCFALIAGAFGILGTLRADDAAPASLLSNANFASLDAEGWPADWPKVEGGTKLSEGEQNVLRLQASEPDKMVMVYRRVNVKAPFPPAVEVRVKARPDLEPGKQKWFDGRVLVQWKDKDDKILKPQPPAPAFKGHTAEWTTKSVYFAVPANAAYLEVMPCLFKVSSGSIDFAEIGVYASTDDKLPKPKPMVPSPATFVPADASKLPPALKVSGNQLVTADGKPVWLQGLCVDSLEWSAGGEHLPGSLDVAIDQWHANTIRLPVKDEMWWGRNKWQKDDGSKYRAIVDSCIQTAIAKGAYVILDLHRFGPMTEGDAAFWKDAAFRYKDNPGVIFELFNEPHSLNWQLWRYGGNLRDAKIGDKNAKENDETNDHKTTVGMQALLDAVRSTGAKNLVVAGGLDWGYELRGILDGYALQDVDGAAGVMYSSHIYPWKNGWQKNMLDIAEKYPVYIGEVGCPEKWEDFKFIPKEMQKEPLGPGATWPIDMIGTIQKHKLNWTAFSFHPKCGPMVISDWDYTPTPYWGVYVKEALAGKQFEAARIR